MSALNEGVIDVCDHCGGDGGFDDTYIGASHEVRSDWHRCKHCDGEGFVFVEAEPVESLPEYMEAVVYDETTQWW